MISLYTSVLLQDGCVSILSLVTSNIVSHHLKDIEKPAFAPVLAFIGVAEGFAESMFLVALLSLVKIEGKNGEIFDVSIY